MQSDDKVCMRRLRQSTLQRLRGSARQLQVALDIVLLESHKHLWRHETRH